MQHDYIGHFWLANWTAPPVFIVRELHIVCMHPSPSTTWFPYSFQSLCDVYITKWCGNMKYTRTYMVFQQYLDLSLLWLLFTTDTVQSYFNIFQSKFLYSYSRTSRTNNVSSESLIVIPINNSKNNVIKYQLLLNKAHHVTPPFECIKHYKKYIKC